MSNEPLSRDIMEVHRGLVREAVEAERDRGNILARNEYERGFREGETKQAILEVQGRDRFLAECKCPKCGRSVEQESEPPAAEPMTIPKLVERLREGDCVLPSMYLWSDIENDLQDLVEAQVRRDAKYIEEWLDPGTGRVSVLCSVMADGLLKSAGLE